MLHDAVDLLAAAPTVPPPGFSRGMAMLIVLMAAGFALVFAFAILASLRRGRNARRAADQRLAEHRRASTEHDSTPWVEAGKRAKPEDGDHWIPSDDDMPTKG